MILPMAPFSRQGLALTAVHLAAAGSFVGLAVGPSEGSAVEVFVLADALD